MYGNKGFYLAHKYPPFSYTNSHSADSISLSVSKELRKNKLTNNFLLKWSPHEEAPPFRSTTTSDDLPSRLTRNDTQYYYPPNLLDYTPYPLQFI